MSKLFSQKQFWRLEEESHKRYLRKAKTNKEIFSSAILIGDGDRIVKKKLAGAMKHFCHDLINRHIFDNVKAPHMNPGKSALLSNAAFDVHFGMDIPGNAEDNDTIERTAYGIGTGLLTTGLDQRKHKVFPFPTKLKQIRDIVEDQVSKHYAEQGLDLNCKFNHCAIKIYYNNKEVGLHTDVTFNRSHTAPTPDNSQIPKTPVAIITFGAKKYLEFVQFRPTTPTSKKSITQRRNPNRKTKKRKRKANVQDTSDKKEKKFERVHSTHPLRFYQHHGSFFVLDPRDEALNNNKFWRHRSKLLDPENDVCIAILFRVVQKSVRVRLSDSTIVNPVIPGGLHGTKIQQFDEAWNEIDQSEEYLQEKTAALQKIRSGLEKYF